MDKSDTDSGGRANSVPHCKAQPLPSWGCICWSRKVLKEFKKETFQGLSQDQEKKKTVKKEKAVISPDRTEHSWRWRFGGIRPARPAGSDRAFPASSAGSAPCWCWGVPHPAREQNRRAETSTQTFSHSLHFHSGMSPEATLV